MEVSGWFSVLKSPELSWIRSDALLRTIPPLGDATRTFNLMKFSFRFRILSGCTSSTAPDGIAFCSWFRPGYRAINFSRRSFCETSLFSEDCYRKPLTCVFWIWNGTGPSLIGVSRSDSLIESLLREDLLCPVCSNLAVDKLSPLFREDYSWLSCTSRIYDTFSFERRSLDLFSVTPDIWWGIAGLHESSNSLVLLALALCMSW